MIEPRLFVLAPEVMHFHAAFVAGEGWHLTVVVRAQSDLWSDAYRADYHHLTTPELFDVFSDEAAARLGLA